MDTQNVRIRRAPKSHFIHFLVVIGKAPGGFGRLSVDWLFNLLWIFSQWLNILWDALNLINLGISKLLSIIWKKWFVMKNMKEFLSNWRTGFCFYCHVKINGYLQVSRAFFLEPVAIILNAKSMCSRWNYFVVEHSGLYEKSCKNGHHVVVKNPLCINSRKPN